VLQFAQVAFSLAAYIILPFTCQFVKRRSRAAYSFAVLASACATTALLASYPLPWRLLYGATHISLVFVCPACLLSVHKFKAQINGPWDEAVPRLDLLVKDSSRALRRDAPLRGAS
jgi:Phosphatidylinositol N-acetylglucosaminyltransferase